jgi:lysophospholipase L1-like esterase
MELSTEQRRWLMKVLQPERTVASLPGGATVSAATCAALLGLEPETYSAELALFRKGAKETAQELLTESEFNRMLDSLPLRKGARIVAFGDSHTADPQSWAVILQELLAARRPQDEVSVDISAVGGETTTHGLVRLGHALVRDTDWIIFFIGVNDARAQGPNAGKTLVDASETVRNLEELRSRAAKATKARRLWITPPPVLEDRVSKHWGLSRFGVRFRNEDVRRVAEAIRALGEPTIDLFAAFGASPSPEDFTEDGLHLSLAGQRKVVLELIQSWSRVQ